MNHRERLGGYSNSSMEIFLGVFPLAKEWGNSAKGVCGRPGLISNESWHCLGGWRQMHLCFKNEVMDNLGWCSFYFWRRGFTLTLKGNVLFSDTSTELRQSCNTVILPSYIWLYDFKWTIKCMLSKYGEDTVNRKLEGKKNPKKIFPVQFLRFLSWSSFRISINVFDGIQIKFQVCRWCNLDRQCSQTRRWV